MPKQKTNNATLSGYGYPHLLPHGFTDSRIHRFMDLQIHGFTVTLVLLATLKRLYLHFDKKNNPLNITLI